MTKRYTPIELDKTRNLRYNFNALRYIEEQMNKPAFAVFDSLAKMNESPEQIKATDILILLLAGLRHEDKNLTIDQLGEIVDLSTLSEVVQSIFKAFTNNMPEKTGDAPLETESGK